jgi:hypothetical protein
MIALTSRATWSRSYLATRVPHTQLLRELRHAPLHTRLGCRTITPVEDRVFLPRRTFKSLSSDPPPIAQPTTKTPPKDLVGGAEHVTQAEQRKSDWKIIKRLMVHVWPKDDWKTRGTVLFGFGLLVGGKVCCASV